MKNLKQKKYKGAVCKGSYALGTACGACERCKDNMAGSLPDPKPRPSALEAMMMAIDSLSEGMVNMQGAINSQQGMIALANKRILSLEKKARKK